MGKRLKSIQKKVQKSSSHQKMLVLHGLERPVMVMIDFSKDEIAFQMQGDANGVKARFSQMLVAGFESMQRAVAQKQSLPQQIQEAVAAAVKGPAPEGVAPASDVSPPVDAAPEEAPAVSEAPVPERPVVQETGNEAEAG